MSWNKFLSKSDVGFNRCTLAFPVSPCIRGPSLMLVMRSAWISKNHAAICCDCSNNFSGFTTDTIKHISQFDFVRLHLWSWPLTICSGILKMACTRRIPMKSTCGGYNATNKQAHWRIIAAQKLWFCSINEIKRGAKNPALKCRQDGMMPKSNFDISLPTLRTYTYPRTHT